MLVALLHPVVFGAALRVQGDTSCPSPSEVSANVQAIVDLSEDSAAKVHATLRRDGAWLELELSEIDGTSLGERRVAAEEDCSALARTAGVMLAAWLSNEHPEFLVTLPAAAGAAASGPSAQPEPPMAKTAAPKVSPIPQASARSEASAPAVADHAGEPKAASVAARHQLRLGIAGGGSLSGTQLAPGLFFAISWAPATVGLGARLTAGWLGPRSEPLGLHRVSWARWPLMAGPYLRMRTGPLNWELEAGPALGWLRLEGIDFSPNSARGDIVFGTFAGLRLEPQLTSLHAFAALTPLFWFGSSTATANTAGGDGQSERELPSFELLMTVGLDLPL